MTTVIQWLARLQFQGTHPLLQDEKRCALLAMAKSVSVRTWRDTKSLREPVLVFPSGPAEHLLAQRGVQATILYEDSGAWLTYGCIAYPTLLGGLIVNARKLRPSKRQTLAEVKTAKQEIVEGVYCWLTSSLEPADEVMYMTAYDKVFNS